ncbi:hypothetical protein C5167_049055 [Papaver somniferum]|uniref:AP2/ERF domain-containing protein n=1 Tax=Papaver somniferum TaxID=3469 RepID=A0A4Y7KL53_PAPSO|nr:ethylene-responsive transcription factor ERF014-like [Papaver somniferum]RZC73577.1 hypothetical protein C5167_049055 [Papaver somniferum]
MVKCEEKSIQLQAESSTTTLSSSSSICKSVAAKPSSSSTAKTSPSLSSRKIKKYKGVRMRSWGSWVSEIRAPNQKTRIWLGSYSTAEAAARAYDAALLCLKGSSANLNFPNSSISSFPHLHAAAAADNNSMSMNPKTIQRVAAAAAAATTTVTPINNTTINIPSPSSPSLLSLSHTLPSNLSSPSPSISISSSPSPSSSCSTHQDIDEVSLIQCWDTYTPSTITSGSAISHYNNVQEAPMSITRPVNNDPWMDLFGDLQSPKFNVDHLLSSCPSFAPAPLSVDEYFYEDSDIRLWSFC